jgi:UDP-glucose 4-epimerase
LTENKTPIALTPARDWDRSGQRFAATDKSRDKLGFVASIGHEEGLRRTVEWTKAHRAAILTCMRQHIYFVPAVAGYHA